MTANPPHPPGPGERSPVSRRREIERGALAGGLEGILSVTLATVALALAAAVVAALAAWLV